jgi:hypothetical protein
VGTAGSRDRLLQAFTVVRPRDSSGDMAKVSVNGVWFNLRMIRPLSRGQAERFGVNAWIQVKYSLTYQQTLLFFAQRSLDKTAANIILFSDESSWRDAENVSV